jgi:hypothetical protein
VVHEQRQKCTIQFQRYFSVRNILYTWVRIVTVTDCRSHLQSLSSLEPLSKLLRSVLDYQSTRCYIIEDLNFFTNIKCSCDLHFLVWSLIQVSLPPSDFTILTLLIIVRINIYCFRKISDECCALFMVAGSRIFGDFRCRR